MIMDALNAFVSLCLVERHSLWRTPAQQSSGRASTLHAANHPDLALRTLMLTGTFGGRLSVKSKRTNADQRTRATEHELNTCTLKNCGDDNSMTTGCNEKSVRDSDLLRRTEPATEATVVSVVCWDQPDRAVLIGITGESNGKLKEYQCGKRLRIR